jgi:4a-hydroxytetrahydrobiopterin dehydratase
LAVRSRFSFRPALDLAPATRHWRRATVERLVGAARIAAIKERHGWVEAEDRNAIRKIYHFGTFMEAWGFMSQVALIVGKMGDHPEWFNVYNRVEIILTTHDAGGLSQQDIRFAHLVDEIEPVRDRRAVP